MVSCHDLSLFCHVMMLAMDEPYLISLGNQEVGYLPTDSQVILTNLELHVTLDSTSCKLRQFPTQFPLSPITDCDDSFSCVGQDYLVLTVGLAGKSSKLNAIVGCPNCSGS